MWTTQKPEKSRYLEKKTYILNSVKKIITNQRLLLWQKCFIACGGNLFSQKLSHKVSQYIMAC